MHIARTGIGRKYAAAVRLAFEHVPGAGLRYSSLAPAVRQNIGEYVPEKLAFAGSHGYWPQFRNPQSFSEKIYHRKYYTDYPEYVMLADKHAVREFVRDRVGNEVLTDLYHVTDDPSTIRFDALPEQFVVKATHGSGSVRVVTDDEFDSDVIRQECAGWLSGTFGSDRGEYWYDRIPPQIVVEEYIDTPDQEVPRDYKFYVFDGRVRAVHVDVNRYSDGEHTRSFYDRDWTPIDVRVRYPRGEEAVEPPDFEQMRSVAERLGRGIDFARIDLYNPREGEVRFGEVTLSPGAGRERFDPVVRDFQLGTHWSISPPNLGQH